MSCKFANRNLKANIATAIAWGKPCHESIGYTEDEFIELLNLALDRIKYLESVLEENNLQYTMTDW